MMTQAEDYGRLPFGRRVLSTIVGRGLVVSEGESWGRQRRAMALAFTLRNVAGMARHIISAVICGIRRDSPVQPR